MLKYLRSDPAVRLAAVALIGALGMYALPVSNEWLRDPGYYLAEGALVLSTLFAVLWRRKQLKSPEERGFWSLIAVAYAGYLVTLTLSRYPEWQPAWIRAVTLTEDTLNFLFYAAFLIAIVTAPHVRQRRSSTHRRTRIRAVGSLVFTAGLTVYFVLVPAALTDGLGHSSILVYVVLDVLVALGFLSLRPKAPLRWRWIYGLLAVHAFTWAAVDLTEGLMYWGALPFVDTGSLLDFLWYVPPLLCVVAARMREYPFAPEAGPPSTEQEAPSLQSAATAPLLVYLCAVPLMHFAWQWAGSPNSAERPARELCVLVVVTLLGGLVIADQRIERHERRRIEASLREAQKMQAIGRLAGGVAHDFNNLLTVINGYSRMALAKMDENDDLRRDLIRILGAGERATLLTSQLLAFSRKQRLEPVLLNFNDLVAGTVSMLERVIGEDVDLQLELDPDLWNVEADRGQLEQVLVNLTLNAKDAMPGGGRLEIRTRNEAGAGGPRAALSVTDTGSGMDADTLRQVFDPFFTTKDNGTGLGLSTAYGIARQHGGDFTASSEPGAGTSMEILLPRAAESAKPARTEGARQVRRPRGSEVILVVEDEDAVRDVVSRSLEERGYEVLAAAGAEEAMRLFEIHGARISLVLTDVVMPGESGPQLCARLVERRPGLRVLFMSGYSDTDLMRKAAPDGALPLIQKPFRAAALELKVREVLDRPARPTGGRRPASTT